MISECAELLVLHKLALGFVLQHQGFGKIRSKLASPSSSP